MRLHLAQGRQPLAGVHNVSAARRETPPDDSVRDFNFMPGVSAFPFVMAVRKDNPAGSLADLLALARQSADKLK